MLVGMIDREAFKAAREYKKLSQAKLAAKAGVAPQLIGQLERGEVRSTKAIYRIADVLGVQARQLDTAIPETEDVDRRLIPIVGYVGAGAEIFAIDDHQKGAGLEEIEMPVPGMSPSSVAVRVRGTSMEPAYYDRDLIFYDRRDEGDFAHLIGKECIIALADGRKFIKILKRSPHGEWYLHSNNSDPILDINIEWAAKVKFIQRS